MFHVRYYSHATKACSTSQIERDWVYTGATSWRVVGQSEAG